MAKRLFAMACVVSLALAPAVALAQQANPVGSGTTRVQTGGAAGTQVAQAAGAGAVTTSMVISTVAVAGLVAGLAIALTGSSSTGTNTSTSGTDSRYHMGY